MTQFDLTITEINYLVKWWLDLNEGFDDIVMLLDRERRLSGYLYHLANEFGR